MIDSSKYLKKISLYKSNLWEEKKPFLVNLDIELTERCNLNCQHCYINQPATNNKTEDKIKSFEQEELPLFESLGKVFDAERIENKELEVFYSQIDRINSKIQELEKQIDDLS